MIKRRLENKTSPPSLADFVENSRGLAQVHKADALPW